jgi:hypothetical protein
MAKTVNNRIISHDQYPVLDYLFLLYCFIVNSRGVFHKWLYIREVFICCCSEYRVSEAVCRVIELTALRII